MFLPTGSGSRAPLRKSLISASARSVQHAAANSAKMVATHAIRRPRLKGPATVPSSSQDRCAVVISACWRGSGDCGGQMQGESCRGLVSEGRMRAFGIAVGYPSRDRITCVLLQVGQTLPQPEGTSGGQVTTHGNTARFPIGSRGRSGWRER